MSTKQATPETAAKAEKAAPATPPKFTVERLRRDCRALFGVTVSTYDGATYGLSEEYTVEEMRNHIQKWQSTGISAPKKTKKEAN